MMITKPKIEPCCANQNPSLNPPILTKLSCSTNKIPHPNDIKNHKLKRMLM